MKKELTINNKTDNIIVKQLEEICSLLGIFWHIKNNKINLWSDINSNIIVFNLDNIVEEL